jgi:anthranilate phosphoribosyltransferase
VVHGAGGADEITLAGPNRITELRDGKIRSFELAPKETGLPAAPVEALKGGDAEHNAAALRAVLEGVAGPYADAVLVNAAAALVIAGRADDLASGIRLAKASIDEGAAMDRLKRLVAASNA